MKKRTLFLLTTAALAGSTVGYSATQLLGARVLDNAGDVLSLTNGAGQTVTRAYHLDGSLAASTNLLDNVLIPTYNRYGLIAGRAVTGEDTATPSNFITYHYYHPSLRIKSVQTVNVSGSNDSNGQVQSVVESSYDVGGHTTQSTMRFMQPGTNAPVAPSAYTTQYTEDPYSGATLEKDSYFGTNSGAQNQNQWVYTYSKNGVQTINVYPISNGKTSTKTAAITIKYVYSSGTYTAPGQVLEIKRTPGYNTYNIYGKGPTGEGRMVGILIGSGSYSTMYQNYINIKSGTQKPANDGNGTGERFKNIEAPGVIVGYLYHYNLSGNPLEIDIYSNTPKAQGYIRNMYTYGPLNHFKKFYVPQGGSSVISADSGSILYPTNTLGTPMQAESFTYGMNDNIKTVNITEYARNQESAPEIQYQYGYNNNIGHPNQLHTINTYPLTQGTDFPYESAMAGLNDTPYQYNAAGAVVQDPQGDEYTYNRDNQMVAATNTDSYYSNHYGYNAAGLETYEQSYVKTNSGTSTSDMAVDGEPVYFFGKDAQVQYEKNGDKITNVYLPGLATITETTGS